LRIEGGKKKPRKKNETLIFPRFATGPSIAAALGIIRG
jgi:hypothetical protein